MGAVAENSKPQSTPETTAENIEALLEVTVNPLMVTLFNLTCIF